MVSWKVWDGDGIRLWFNPSINQGQGSGYDFETQKNSSANASLSQLYGDGM